MARPEISAQPRARGDVSVSCKLSNGRSVLDRFYQSGSAKCLFPRYRRAGLESVFLNTSGGVTGGDRMSFSVRAQRGTTMSVTTQACERAYKAQPGQIGVVRNRVTVEAGARVNWLPQETILYNGAALDRRLEVDLAPDAQLLMVEPLVFGRAAMGETLTQAFLTDKIDIRREEKPLFVDATRLHGDAAAHLAKPFIANGAGAMALVVYVAPDAEARLPHLRDLLPETAGATLIGDDVLVLRLLSSNSFALRRALLPMLSLLNDDEIPRCWMI